MDREVWKNLVGALVTGALCMAALVFAPAPAAAQTSLDAPVERSELWQHERHWVSVALFTAGMTTSAALRLSAAQPFSEGLIGVKVREDGTIDGNIAEEISGIFAEKQRVSGAELFMFIGVAGVASMLASGEGVCGRAGTCDGRDQALLDTSLGFMEAMGATLLVTDVLKYIVARARPDYNDRLRRFRCDQDPTSSACITGRLSFPSGHASMSFAAATFASLVVGGRFVWGDHVRATDNPASSIVPGVFGQLVLMGGATYIAVSRVLDSRHNVSDILAGAAIGTLISSVVYFTYFDTDGHHFDADRTAVAAPTTTAQPVMFSFGGSF